MPGLVVLAERARVALVALVLVLALERVRPVVVPEPVVLARVRPR